MVVALAAGEREAEPGGACRVDPVEEVVETLLLGNRPPFAVEEVIPVEAAGYSLLDRRVGEEIAGKLLGREAVERHVGIEGPNDPVPPHPLPGVTVLLESVGIGVAGGIEPRQRHPFAVMRAGKEPVDEFFVGVRSGIGDEGVDLLGRRRDADEIGREAADEGRPVGFRGRGHARPLDTGQNKNVDRVADPAAVVHRRRLGAGRWLEGPVLAVLGPGGDPPGEKLLLLGGELPIRRRRRHDDVVVRGMDPLEDRTRAGISRDDRPGGQRRVAVIEAQISLPLVAILPVAVEAVFREDRSNVAVEVDRGLGGGQGGTGQADRCRQHAPDQGRDPP